MTRPIKIFLLFILIFLFCHKSYCQSNCLIYQSILCSLNDEYKNIKYSYVGLVDPESPDIGKSIKRKGNHQLRFFLIDELEKFDIDDVKRQFSTYIDEALLFKYQEYPQDSILSCVFTGHFKYQYTDFNKVVSFSAEDYMTEKKGKDSVSYTPVRIIFSKVAYSQQYNKAIVAARVLIGSGGNESLHYFFLKKKRKKWRLYKSQRTNM